jgi:hypothetical protein
MPPEWLAWEFWVDPAAWLWTLWVANRDDFVPFATLIGGAIGIYLLWIRTRAADRTAQAALDQARIAAEQSQTAAERHREQTTADLERRLTESFAKAVEQLGSEKLELRLGGIYTLERLARESEREYWPIMETLTAFVRERAPWPPKETGAETVGPESEPRARSATGRRPQRNRRRPGFGRRRTFRPSLPFLAASTRRRATRTKR